MYVQKQCWGEGKRAPTRSEREGRDREKIFYTAKKKKKKKNTETRFSKREDRHRERTEIENDREDEEWNETKDTAKIVYA